MQASAPLTWPGDAVIAYSVLSWNAGNKGRHARWAGDTGAKRGDNGGGLVYSG